MEIIYSAEPVSDAGDREVIDPKEFTTPIPGVRVVYYDGDNLRLKYGYETRGVEVRSLSDLPKRKTKPAPKESE